MLNALNLPKHFSKAECKCLPKIHSSNNKKKKFHHTGMCMLITFETKLTKVLKAKRSGSYFDSLL